MAQLAGIMCLEIWETSVYACSKSVVQEGALFSFFLIYTCFAQIITVVSHALLVLLFFRLKINQTASCSDCAFILVLSVDVITYK
jgi:hypothetical protein